MVAAVRLGRKTAAENLLGRRKTCMLVVTGAMHWPELPMPDAHEGRRLKSRCAVKVHQSSG